MGKMYKSLLSIGVCIGLLHGGDVSADPLNNHSIQQQASTNDHVEEVEMNHTFKVVDYKNLDEEQRRFYNRVVMEEGIHQLDNMFIISLGSKPNTCYDLKYVKQEQALEMLHVHLKKITSTEGEACGEAIVYPHVIGFVDVPFLTTINFLNENGKKFFADEKTIEAPPFIKAKQVISTLRKTESEYIGDVIHFKYSITNNTDEERRFEFSSGQTFDYIIRNAKGNEILRYSTFASFIQAFQTYALKPRETVNFNAPVEKKKLDPGTYTIEFWLTANNTKEKYQEIMQFEIQDEKRVEPITFDSIVLNGNTMVPLRNYFEYLGARVQWVKESNIAVIEKEDLHLIVNLGTDKLKINGKKHRLSVPTQVINGQTMLPVRFLSETLGADVKWNAKTKEAVISANNEVIRIRIRSEI